MAMPERQEQPADRDHAAVHRVEHLQRRQARVEEAEMPRLDFLEEQNVGHAEHAGQREAGVGEEHRDDVQREERALEERRTRAGHGVERRNQIERDDEGRHEHAHRPFVGRQLDVEIREAEQPDERRERGGRADERRVADVHRLHADEKRVREHTAAEDGRRQPPDARIAPGEVGQIGGGRRSVEDERNEVHDTYRPWSGP